MESGLSTATSLSAHAANLTVDLQAFVNDFGDGDLVLAARRFDVVRYIVVACATIAILDRLLITKTEISMIWNGPMTMSKFFYFLTRYPNLCCVGLDVYVVTRRVSNLSDCVWWFAFRSWATVIVGTIMEALLVFQLWGLFGKCKYIFLGFSMLSVSQTIGTSYLVTPRMKYVQAAPFPGSWFSGYFPFLTDPHALSHEWVLLTAVVGAMALTAIAWTICTWRKARCGGSDLGSDAGGNGVSLWKIARQNSVLYVLGIWLTTVFCTIFFLTAPQPLSSIVPSVSSTMFSVLGCRIAIDMPECYNRCDLLRPLPPPLEHELEELSRRKVKRVDDLEAGVVVEEEGKMTPEKGLDISPLSQAATLVPAKGEHHHQEDGRAVVHPFGASEVTLSSSEAQIRPQKPTAESRRSTLVGGGPARPTDLPPPPPPSAFAPKSKFRESRESTSSPAARASRGRSQEEEEAYYEELDQKLAEEYDEEGRRRPPRRTHQRQWRSDDYLGMPHMLSGQGFLMPRTSSPLYARPASAIYYSPSRQFAAASSSRAFPQPSPRSSVIQSGSPSPSGSTTPSRRRSNERSMSPRARMSLFFQRYRNDVPVPEEEVSASFPPPPATTTTDAATSYPPPPQPVSRRQSTSSSKSRVKRLLLSGTSSSSTPSSDPSNPQSPASPSPTSPITSPRRSSAKRSRRDSDGMSICTVSTDFAFDNSGTCDVPDFN